MLFPLVRAYLSEEWIPLSKVPKEAKFLWVDYLALIEAEIIPISTPRFLQILNSGYGESRIFYGSKI